jgi:hypothetical protein
MRTTVVLYEENQDPRLPSPPPVPGVAEDQSQPPLLPDLTRRTKARTLPKRQPTRALTVLLGYLAAVAMAVGPLVLVFGGALGGLLIFAWACLLTVPVALLAPRPTHTPESPEEGFPVLKRPPTPPS